MKISTTLELRKEVRVIYYELNASGLTEEYARNGVKHILELDQLQTVKLLRQAGLIDSYEKTRYNKVYVSYETEQNSVDQYGEHVQCQHFVYCEFHEFVTNTTFSQYDALSCAIHAERMRQEREEYARIYKTQIAEA